MRKIIQPCGFHCIKINNLGVSFGEQTVLEDVNMHIHCGSFNVIIGQNGAGKSTTMNIITGYISSTSGTVTIDGKEILENPKEAKAKIGYLPEIPPLYTDMTVKKYLEFMFDLKKVKLPKKEHIEEVMRLVRITEQADRIIKNLSKGYRQRVGFAQALLGNPPVLILDEPTVGLDPMQIIEIRKLIKSLGKKHTIILSSHVLSEISATCDRILVISNGKIVADAKTDQLSSSTAGEEKLALVVEGAASDIISAIKNIPAVIRVNKISEKNGNSAKYMVEYEKDHDVRRDVFNAMARIGCPILDMQSGNETLEEMFLKLTANGNYDTVGGKK